MLALIFVLGLLCLSVHATNGTNKIWTVQQLKQSQVWKDDQVPLVLTKSGHTCNLQCPGPNLLMSWIHQRIFMAPCTHTQQILNLNAFWRL